MDGLNWINVKSNCGAQYRGGQPEHGSFIEINAKLNIKNWKNL